MAQRREPKTDCSSRESVERVCVAAKKKPPPTLRVWLSDTGSCSSDHVTDGQKVRIKGMEESSSHRRRKLISDGAEALTTRIRRALSPRSATTADDEPHEEEGEGLSVSTLSDYDSGTEKSPVDTIRRRDADGLTRRLHSANHDLDKRDDLSGRMSQRGVRSLGKNLFRTLSSNGDKHRRSATIRSSNSGKNLLAKYVPGILNYSREDEDREGPSSNWTQNPPLSSAVRIRSQEELQSLQDHLDGLSV